MDFQIFDARGYETLLPVDGYREWAATYDSGMSDDLHIHLLERMRGIHLGAVREAVDLACGTGRIGAWLSREVETIDGADLTSEMLDVARVPGHYRRLVCADMRDTPFPDGSYDLCTQVLACEHIPDLAPLYREAKRLLRPGGAFVIIGYHPHFLLNGIPTHFDRPTGESVAIQNWVHLLSDHVAAAHDTGFALADLRERVIDDEWLEREPAWSRYRGRPVSFGLGWRVAP